MVFSQNLRWNMIFLVWPGRMIFLFLENMILPLRQKMKDNLSQKKYTEIWYFLQTFWKDGLFKKSCAGAWYFLYYLERWYFFPQKYDIFFLNWKWEMIFLKKYMEIWYFLCLPTGVTNVAPCPLPPSKNQRWSYPTKIHLKVIYFLDLHSRKSSGNSRYFRGDPYRRFHALLSSEKTQET